MPVTTKLLRDISEEALPILRRQKDDAEMIAGLRNVISAQGGDWSALKALLKAQVDDEADDDGEGKRVRKILDKADSSTAYADLLGLAKMNEENFSAASYAEAKGRGDAKLVATVANGMQTEMGRKALVTALDIMIEREESELTDNQEQPETASEVPAQDGGGTATGESPSGKSNAARPASVDAHVNGGRLAGQVSVEAVTVVGDESGTLTNSRQREVMDLAAVEAVTETASRSPVSTDQSNSQEPLISADAAGEVTPTQTHASPAEPFEPVAFLRQPKPLRPDCLHPGEQCRGYGTVTCHSCKVAAREREAVEA